MHINIARRLRPFAHLPGTACLLPNSFLGLRIYPTRIIIDRLNEALPVQASEIHLNIKGPLNGFTVEQDLEKGCIRVWGHAESGYFRYRLTAEQNNPFGFIWEDEKKTSGSINPSFDPLNGTLTFSRDQSLRFKSNSIERLSLGDHRAQNIAVMEHQQNLKAIFPNWLRLGQLLSFNVKPHHEGTAALLHKCADCYEPPAVLAPFLNLFKVGFQDLFYPSLIDLFHQGIDCGNISGQKEISPLVLLQEGARLIRRLFIETGQDEISVLPCLPSEFNCGRFLHLQCGSAGRLDIEWTKKQVRRMIFYSNSDQLQTFRFPREIRRYRFRKEGAKKEYFFESSTRLEMEKDTIYYFDNFQR